MKKVTPYFAMFVWVIAIFISGCSHSAPSEVIVKNASGIYHIDGKLESLDLEMADGGEIGAILYISGTGNAL